MARKNPIESIKDAALGTAQKAASLTVESAKGGVGLGKLVAGTAASKAADTVTSLIPGRKQSTPSRPAAAPATTADSPDASGKVQGDALAPEVVPPVRKPASKAPAKKAPVKKSPAKASPAKKAAASVLPVKDPAAPTKPESKPAPTGTKAPATKAPAKKTPAKKAPAAKVAVDPTTPVNVTEELGLDPAPVETKPAATKAPAKKAPAKKAAAATKAAAKKAPAKKAPAKKAAATPASAPESTPTSTEEPVTGIDAQADTSDVDVTPADIASAVAKKSTS